MIAPLKWSDWKSIPSRSDPYIHWWKSTDGNADYIDDNFVLQEVNAFRDLSSSGDTAVHEFNDGSFVPVAKDSTNPEWSGDDSFAPAVPAEFLGAADDLDENTVIMGVIDHGIGLGHRRFRKSDGSTRVLSAWQQSSRFAGQAHLPFGRELFRDEINHLLEQHSPGENLHASLDEMAFNRAAGLIETDRRPGEAMRDLEVRTAHGCHVMDLAGGIAPDASDPVMADRVRIMAINLPPPLWHGPAENFLQYFGLMSIKHIVTMAEALWKRRFPGRNGRFPVVINMSFGMQAGPKDGSLPFELAVKDLIQTYGKNDGILRVCMPAGNRNIERGAAVFKGPSGETQTLDWVISPADETSNIVEIWAPVSGADQSDANNLIVSVTPPCFPRMKLPIFGSDESADPNTVHSDLINGDNLIARVYSRVCNGNEADGREKKRQIVVCVSPTLSVEPLKALRRAPAGAWEIGIEHSFTSGVQIELHVQTDQSGPLFSGGARVAYFDHPVYCRFDPQGRLRDSYSYPYKPREELPDDGPISRPGTHNPLATNPYIVMVAGYDRSTGKPETYSATGWDVVLDEKVVPDVDVALPSEDSEATFGLLAAGGRDGSAVPFRGTSMASALAARVIARAIAGSPERRDPSDFGPDWIRAKAEEYEQEGRPSYYGDTATGKTGQGRLPLPIGYKYGRVSRL